MKKTSVYIYIFTIIFSFIFILRTGLVYSYASDQLWTHYILWLQSYSAEDDLLYYSRSWEKSLWYYILIKIKELVTISPLMLYYVLQITHTLLFFLILFKIFYHFNDQIILKKYICFGLLVSCTNFWISGSLANFHEIGYTYRTAPLILGLFSFNYLLTKKINLSIIFLTIASFMHLPIVTPFYLILIVYLKKFSKLNYLVLLIGVFSTLLFIFSNTELSFPNDIYETVKSLINLRMNYIYMENWKFDLALRYFGCYLFFILLYFFSQNKEFKNLILILISVHILYMIFVACTNHLPSFSVFRYGRELFILIFLIFIIFLNLQTKNIFLSVIFYSAIFSQFIFGSFSIFLILLTILYLFQSKSLKKEIASNLYRNIYKNY